MPHSVFVVLAEGFEEIEAVIPIDVLRRAGFDVTTVALARKTVTGSHAIALTADRTWDEVATSTPDLLLLPGGMPGSKHLGEHSGLKEMAERVANSDRYLAAICAAPALTLATWGLLSGREATCYPGTESHFPPNVKHQRASVVVDGKIITACGIGAAMEFSLQLVKLLANQEAAEKIRTQMLVS
ncbi:MAG: DJ-1/PfpI family protein [Planctomycetaceae bacterium]|nr:DJ-1/PfpI family protein [Planctomycetaceae bacterium]